MAAGGLLAVLDDIATILDDVAAMSKLAAKKTVGIVGDDLAVNANAVVGIDPKREIPIVVKIAAGSMANKAVLIPLALALPSAAITPLLMFGGAFLCYEAMHKIMHKKDAKDEEHHQKMLDAIKDSPDALMKLENKKVWGAIGTDTILSAEIIAISLGAVAAAPLAVKAASLAVIGVGMTVGVYGLVGAIVKADDFGLSLQKKYDGKFLGKCGQKLVDWMPKFMKGLSVAGTAAMFAVGGGILMHGIPGVHHAVEAGIAAVTGNGFVAGTLGMLATVAGGAAAGLAAIPAFDALGKGLDKVKAPLVRLVEKFRKKPEAAAETKAPAPALEQASENALSSVPAAKADLAAAAAKPVPSAVPLKVDPTGAVQKFSDLMEKHGLD